MKILYDCYMIVGSMYNIFGIMIDIFEFFFVMGNDVKYVIFNQWWKQ